jgi:hypothetical protein
MDNVQRYEAMASTARGITGQILQREIQDDGTIVEMRHGETAIAALRRHARIIRSNDVRAWQTHAPDPFRRGFFYLDPPRIVVANFEARQAWQHKRGPLAPPYVETPAEFDPVAVFDETIGAMVSPAELAPSDGSTNSRRAADAQLASSWRPAGDQPTEPNPTESFGADAKNGENPSRSRSASKEARVNLKAIGGEGRSPAGSKAARAAADDPSGSDGGEVVDLKTGEVIDPDDFRDPTPEEREREHAELLPDEVTPEEAEEAAGIFDVEDEEAL